MGYNRDVARTYSARCSWSNTYEIKLSNYAWDNLNRDRIYHGHYFDPKPPYGWQGHLGYRRNHLGVISFVSQFNHYRNNIGRYINSGRLWLKVAHAFLHTSPGAKNVIIRGFRYNNWSAPGSLNTSCIDWDVYYVMDVMREDNAYYINLNRQTLDKIANGQIHGFVLWGNDPYDYRIVVKAGGSLNVRSGPGTGYGKIGSVSNGSWHMSKERKNGWHRISYNGRDGWVSGDYAGYLKDSIYEDNVKYGYMYGSRDGGNAPLIELNYTEQEYVKEQCWGYGGSRCTCDSRCHGNTYQCSCDGKVFNTCTCDGRCYGYATTCSCNQAQHGFIPCSCDQKCDTEGRLCRCDEKTYGEYYTCQTCYNKCDGYTSCSTCDGCNSYQACTCNGPCDRDSCDRCHHKNYGLYTENCLRNIIEYPVSKCPEDA